MDSIQIGSARPPPDSRSPRLRGSSCSPSRPRPTRPGWKPANQASTASLVVPVLPYRSGRPQRGCARAAVPTRVTSLSRLLVMKTLRAGMTRAASLSAGARGRRLEQAPCPGRRRCARSAPAPRAAAVGQHRVGLRHLQRRDAAGAQRQRQVVGLAGRRRARSARPSRARRPCRSAAAARMLTRFFDRASASRSVSGPSKRPSLFCGRPAVRADEGRIVDHRGRHHAMFERGRVEEGLEARARLAPRLRDVVERLPGEVEAADQRAHAAGGRVQWPRRRACACGPLRDRPRPCPCRVTRSDGAAPSPPAARGPSAPGRPAPRAQARAGDRHPLAAWPVARAPRAARPPARWPRAAARRRGGPSAPGRRRARASAPCSPAGSVSMSSGPRQACLRSCASSPRRRAAAAACWSAARSEVTTLMPLE